MSQNDLGQLTELEEQFALEYCKDFNRTQAAIRAGYSAQSAANTGTDVYERPRVRKRIIELLRERRQEYPLTIERMQTEIKRLAFADITKVIKSLEGGKGIQLEDLKALPKAVTAAIKSIEQGRYGLRVVFHDKVAALEMLAKHFGFFEEDNKQKQENIPLVYIPDNGRGLNPAANYSGGKAAQN